MAGSTWNGTENLAGFGKLQFALDTSGGATMIDAKSTTVGNWTRNGAEVSITFVNCVYRGRLAGNRLAGTAEFISGPQEGKTWSFQVER